MSNKDLDRRAVVGGVLALGLLPTLDQASAAQEPITMKIARLDHIVLTVADIDKTCEFYHRTCGMEIVVFGQGRKALKFGDQKINLHQAGREIEPKAARPTPGSGDFCMITEVPVEDVKRHIESLGIAIEEGGIVDRTGANGPIRSVYFRDPDHNLVEVSNYKNKG